MKKIRSSKCVSFTSLFIAAVCAFTASATSLLADEPTAPVASHAANDDLSQYKTADALFAHYEEIHLENRRSDNIPRSSDAPDAEIWRQSIRKLDAITADFNKRFPKDPRRWDIAMINLTFYAYRLRNALGMDGGLKSIEEFQAKLQPILAAPDASDALKQNAFNDFVEYGEIEVRDEVSFNQWDQDVKALAKKYPELAAHYDLKMARASALARFDAEKAIAAFNDIANTAKDPAASAKAKKYANELAQNINEEKQAQAQIAALKKNPLDLKFTAVDGRKVDLVKMRGKVVLVDFWATWCGPCMGEVPNVVATYNALHDKGFEIVGISFDQDKASLLKVTKQKGMVWPQYFDGKGWKNDFGTRFGIHGIPTMWLINKKGMLVTDDVRENLAEQVKKLLAE